MRRLHADLILIACAAIWGLAFVYQKTAMDHVGPLLFIACRAAIAALALMPFALYELRHSGGREQAGLLGMGIVAGVAFFLGAALQQAGIVTATVTNSGFLTALYVVIVPFIAWAWHRSAPGAMVWPAVGLSFVGTWLLGGGSLAGLGTGDMLVAASSIFWAAHVVILGVSGRLALPVAISTIQFVVVAVLALAGTLAFEQPSLAAIAAAGPEIAYVGLLSSALTFTLLAVALRHTPPSEAAVLVSLETVFAAIAGAMLVGDRLPMIGWIGAAMIFSATLVVQLGTRGDRPKP
jgi:drug/metabolite transporter (DMT)-like permease